MEQEILERKQAFAVKWIKGASGTSYLCPVDSLDKLANPTEEDLQRICVNESLNPQND